MSNKKDNLFNSARELFYAKGYKDTNVAEIAGMAGLGVGTFYNYYDSKEQIFLEVSIKENERQKKSLLEAYKLKDGDPVALIKELVTQNLRAMAENPILNEWNNPDMATKLEKHFYEQGGIESIGDFYYSMALDLIKKWKVQGKIRQDLNDELVLALLNSVHYVDIHKGDIGVKHFPQLIQHLVEFIMRGLAD